ncbi:MAG TPA: cyclopropane-fatty-acyl-phospholipid synthase family protein [Rhizomicrobium sp.]|nr:cyclopropane-fatty-acyl-phospholipid synthase family protein [Rhizomicrobium sp.]
MDLLTLGGRLAERTPVPDALVTAGMRRRISASDRDLADDSEAAFARDMPRHAIAEHPSAANAQHYELPPEFFAEVLGPRRKYSSCLYPTGRETLARAEECALAETAAHADLRDGQHILELGCGWGSLTLWMAERYPDARIVAVSNSAPQRRHIEAQAQARGLGNVEIVTADMNDFAIDRRFDRIVSVEMFEHMANWRALLQRARGWLAPGGRLFLHVFSHRSAPYRFDHGDANDWIARHFFTGGIMPSHGLIRQFPDLFAVEEEWRWSGLHYRRTALAWLANFDARQDALRLILRSVYGAEAGLWRRRWRMFFLATAEMFGHAGGGAWGVSHYRLRAA